MGKINVIANGYQRQNRRENGGVSFAERIFSLHE
jgi:hypothetical protein